MANNGDDQRMHLSALHQGFPGLTPEQGAAFAQASAVCLDACGHVSGVSLSIEGSWTCSYLLEWTSPTEQAHRAWNDQDEATEFGATAVACLLAVELTPYTIVKRSRRGTGFDWWLGRDLRLPFEARLEISGIRRGDRPTVERRLTQKFQQLHRFGHDLPAIAAVVEFSTPLAIMKVADGRSR